MEIKLKITAPGLKGFLNKLSTFERTFMAKLSAAANKSDRLIVKNIRDSMVSNAWPPNSDSWRHYKSSHSWNTNPLLRTELLKNSVSSERISFSPALISSEVGWWGSARYGGVIAQGIHPGRVPKRRKTDLGNPKADKGQRYDTHFLGMVAEKLEGDRPFVRAAFEVSGSDVVAAFTEALMKSLPISGMEEAPF